VNTPNPIGTTDNPLNGIEPDFAGMGGSGVLWVFAVVAMVWALGLLVFAAWVTFRGVFAPRFEVWSFDSTGSPKRCVQSFYSVKRAVRWRDEHADDMMLHAHYSLLILPVEDAEQLRAERES